MSSTDDRQTRRATIRLLRHAKKAAKPFGHMLAPEGMDAARKLGNQFRESGFSTAITHIGVTRWTRTFQTAAALLEGAGNINVAEFERVDLIGNEAAPEYIDVDAALKQALEITRDDYSLPALLTHAADYVPRGAEAFGSRLAAWASNLPDGAVALLVGHSPIIELATFHVTQRAAIVSGLPELGWVDIEIANDGQYRVVNATVQVKIGDATIMPQPR
jgi:phosphohistidine phosphatase SixA